MANKQTRERVARAKNGDSVHGKERETDDARKREKERKREREREKLIRK